MAKQSRELGVTEDLRRLMHAAPFLPFRIKTTDGDTFTVDHPDFLMISRRGDMAIFYPVEEPGHHVLNLRHVVSLEQMQNGNKKKPGRR